MNLERMLELRDHLSRQSEASFAMEDFLVTRDQWGDEVSLGKEHSDCHTAGCIAGHVALMCFPGGTTATAIRRHLGEMGTTIQDHAATFLGLTERESDTLFLPDSDALLDLGIKNVSLPIALRMIDNCIEAGAVTPELWQSTIREWLS